jgi:hypothetical protein
MLFKPEHIPMIRSGRKTQTRRTWKTPRAKVGSTHLLKTQMLSSENFGRIEILNVHREPLSSMTDIDARAEGYDTLDEFRVVWERINGPGSWDPDLWVYVVQFKFAEGGR